MDRTTVLMEAAYLMPAVRESRTQKLMDYGASWFVSTPTAHESLETLRERMRAELRGTDGCLAAVSERITRANDVTDLWFLRCSLSAALTVDRGADAASVSMQKITGLFEGLLPPGLRERRSALNH